MPGHRKRRQFKQTDAFTRGMVIGLKRADHSISTRTISRRLVANGLHSCRPLRRLPLTPPNRRQRLEWCRARSTWMTEWHRVVFSDESRFCLSSDSRRVRVWRRRGERSNPAAIVERPTVRQRGIMVWGAIAYDSRSPLLRIQGTMTAQRFVDDVLRPVTLPYLQGVPNALYQQDNARPHTARISQQALQDVQMLPWPPYSPDLSPIEHVWDIIGRRLHALPQPRSEDELWQMVEREWRAIPQDAIHTLIDSLPRRVAACIAVRDRNTEVGKAPFNVKCLRGCENFDQPQSHRQLPSEMNYRIRSLVLNDSFSRMQAKDENSSSLRVQIPKPPENACKTLGDTIQKNITLRGKIDPRILTEEQKEVRMEVCQNMIEMTRIDPELSQKIILEDETWVYQYDPETKRQSSQWIERGEQKYKKARLRLLPLLPPCLPESPQTPWLLLLCPWRSLSKCWRRPPPTAPHRRWTLMEAPEASADPRPPAPQPAGAVPQAQPASVAPPGPLHAQETLEPSSSPSSGRTTRGDLEDFLKRNPGVSFAEIEGLGLGREEVLDLLSSKTKVLKRRPPLTPAQRGAIAGLADRLLDLRPGGTTNIYKVLRQVKPGLEDLSREEEDARDERNRARILKIFDQLNFESTLAPLTRQQISPHQVIWALLHPEHATFIEFIFPKNKTILVDFLEEALELAGDVDPVIRKNLITLQADLGS
ncbi:hypothetical protein LAZ67_5004075 [Cordylochernes scorpioides]|uniref:Transposase n=1 Tax=Cordylochernes scorpioides TaxID=51811 RepID=A0ABY6KID0_9ARAC|nr:hypothetical protein LAZ67_5004075 [Cordylochernes scorpioides]